MTTINKKNLAVLHATAKEYSSVYALTHVKIDADMIWASNGHALYGSPIINQHKDFPDCNIPNAVDYKECILLDAALLKSINIPSNKYTPIINNINILVDDTHKHLITTDNKNIQDSKTKHDDLEWPDQKRSINAQDKNTDKKSVCLSIIDLETLIKVVKQHGDTEVSIDIFGPDTQVNIATQSGLIGAIMPTRKDW